MASVSEKPQSESPPRPAQRAGERLVDQHISRTRRSLKLVDFTAGIVTLTIAVLAYLLTMAVLEHWVIPGGWSDSARTLLFVGLLLGIAVYSWRTFWPLLRQSINPAYAAQAIEQHSPTLKNSLLNLLLLRNHKRQMSRQVYQAIEQQAAQGLSQVKIEAVVDRSAILRLGYILVALTAICALYRFLSPKDLITSAGRVLMPWSNMATPSRVQILDVTPGDAKAARGEQLEITAEVLGLEEDEPVRLLYSTADEQIVGQEVSMSSSAGGARFACLVPGRIGVGGARKSGGIQQDFSYWIEAGDARSPRYTVAVFARPTMVVNRLRYEYPTYTGYPTREVEHTGDIRAVEGTKVTLHAQANKPIKAAHVDFDADGRRDVLMNSTDQQATVTFPLELRDDRRTPRYQSYVLRYETTAGNQNQQPPKYQIDVQPDYSPEIQLLLPAEEMLEVALNQEVNFELDTRDPDFALSQVILIGKVGEEQRLQAELLNRNHTGRFLAKLRKTPAEMGLKVGEVMEYWGAAADNRQPEANLAYSAHRKLRVIGPWQGDENGKPNQEGEGQQQQGEGEPQTGDGGQEGQTGAGEPGSSGEGEDGEQGQSGTGQAGDEPNENSEQQQGQGESAAADGDSKGDSVGDESEISNSQQENGEPSDDPSEGGGTEPGKVSSEGDDDGSAFERMAKHFEEHAGKNGEGSEKSDPQQSARGESSNADQQAKSDSKAADGSPDKNQSGENDKQQPQGESASADGDPKGDDPNSEGAKGEPTPEEEKQGERGEQQQQDGDSPAGEMSPEQGEAGAGDSQGEEQGAPNADGGKEPQDKQGDQGEGPEQENSEAASEARDHSESNSESSQGGDRSGGGKEGAGQQADADGKGGAGEQQSADEGAGKASESGEGETGEQAGDQQPAEGKTGESSEASSGNGSKQSEQSGDQPGESAAADGPDPSGDPAGDPSGGTGGKPSTPPPGGETQPGDEANLEFARKQTDLILDRLEDQLKKKEVDKSLLEKLGWTQDELRRFVDRWKNLKAQADEPSDSTAANEELNAALRSLGLGRNRRTGFQSKISKDKLRDLQDAFRGRVPLEYQEQVNRYIKGTATAQATSSQEGE